MASDHDDVNLRGHIHHAVETSPTWDHLRWMRTVTDLPIILKGILTGEHTRLVVRAGARAVVVRDHAGRPRDRITCALDALPEVVSDNSHQPLGEHHDLT